MSFWSIDRGRVDCGPKWCSWMRIRLNLCKFLVLSDITTFASVPGTTTSTKALKGTSWGGRRYASMAVHVGSGGGGGGG